MAQFGRYGFAPIAMVLSFVADNCGQTKTIGRQHVAIADHFKMSKAARTEALR